MENRTQYSSVRCDMLYLAGIQSVLCQLLVTCLWLPTADEGFNIIQQPAQSTTIVLPAGPLLQAGTTITFLAFHVSAQTPDSKERFFPQELPSLFMHGFRLPSANAHYKPGSSFEKPLPVPGPGTAKLWLWLPAVPTHLPDT